MIELLLPMTLMFSNTYRSEGAFLPLTIAVTAIAVTAIAVTAIAVTAIAVTAGIFYQ